jgi:WD40 repeat protein
MNDTTTTAQSQTTPETRNINTGGGAYLEGGSITASQISGGVNNIGGTMGNVTILTTEQAYQVHGLPNPYLGLRNFTYEDRAAYAGRETSITNVVDKITSLDGPLPLFFVTGASGSGKSSFAQAGVVPALEKFYSGRGFKVQRAVMRPAKTPYRRLLDTLRQLCYEVTQDDVARVTTPEQFNTFLNQNTPPNQVNLLVIDQFEEIFTQADPKEAQILTAILSKLDSFTSLRTHIIATFRVDYLPELFQRHALYELAKQGCDLRAMNVDELREAIERPVQHLYPNGLKRVEPDLVEKLAQDAAEDAAYLPLLQITLEELWNKGSLHFSAYHDLTEAIKSRAEAVFNYEAAIEQQMAEAVLSYNASGKARNEGEKAEIIKIFLDLVNVSQDSDAHRDVRRPRLQADLENGSILRKRLLKDLCDARLVRIRIETVGDNQVEIIDIIHESLITNWERLRLAIAAHRRTLQQRARFETELQQWLNNSHNRQYLLDGIHLAEARELDISCDISTVSREAQDLIKRSSQQQELKNKRRLQIVVGFAAILLVVAIAAVIAFFFALSKSIEADQQRIEAKKQAAIADNQRVQADLARSAAERAARSNKAHALVTNAEDNFRVDPDLSILLASAAINTTLRYNEPIDSSATGVLRLAIINSELRFTIAAHDQPVDGVAFSPDGHFFASASDDKTVKIWEVQTHQLSKTLVGHTDFVNSVAYSLDNKYIITASHDQTARVWDASTGEVILILRGHTGDVRSAAFSPDGKYIVTASLDGTAKIWDSQFGQLQRTFQGHLDGVRTAVFSPDGKYVATASYDKTVKIWDWTTGQILHDFSDADFRAFGAFYSPDGKKIAVSYEDPTVRIYDVETGKIVQLLAGHSANVRTATFSADGQYIVTASYDNTARVWQADTGKLYMTLYGHSNTVAQAVFSPDGQYILTGSYDGTIKIWNARLESSRLSYFDPKNSGAVYSAALSPNDKLLVTTQADNTAKIWDAQTRQLQQTLKGHRDRVNAASFSPDAKMVATASDDGTVKVWNSANGQLIRTLVVNQPQDTNKISVNSSTGKSEVTTTYSIGGVNAVAFSADGKYLATGSDDGLAKIWDANTGQLLQTLSGHSQQINSVAFSPTDKQILLTASNDNTARLWDISTGKAGPVLTGHTYNVNSAAFSADGKSIVTASQDKLVKIWDSTTGQLLKTLPIYPYAINDAVFSHDGAYILVVSNQIIADVWNVQTLQRVDMLPGHHDKINTGVFSQDDSFIITASNDGTAQKHLFKLDDLLQLAQSRATRSLTADEKAKYNLTESQTTN